MADQWVEIAGSNYCLKSDRLCWIVSRRLNVEKSNSFPDGFKHVDFTYHSTLSNAFQRVFDETVRLSDYESIRDLLRIIEETHRMLKEILDHEFVTD